MADPMYICGMRAAAAMFNEMDVNPTECDLRSYGRLGPAQDNAVYRALGQVLMRGNPKEIEGFCAALTGILTRALEEMAPGGRYLTAGETVENHADRLQKVARRRLDRAPKASEEVAHV
jgi:hypothetical protein